VEGSSSEAVDRDEHVLLDEAQGFPMPALQLCARLLKGLNG
jgi:superfamily I DNA and RNA helicase